MKVSSNKRVIYWKDKWSKHKVMVESSSLKPYFPDTTIYNSTSLSRYINKYAVVFLKPKAGTGGIGIIKITKKGARYKIQKGLKIKKTSKFATLSSIVKQMTHNQKYLIQKGIHLARIKGRPVDFRVLSYKPANKWIVYGVMGKVAAPGKIVTNYHRGGKPITLSKALTNSLGMTTREHRRIENKLASICRRVGNVLSHRTNIRELGVDIAIDRKRKIWIIEANTKPRFNLFRYHPNNADP